VRKGRHFILHEADGGGRSYSARFAATSVSRSTTFLAHRRAALASIWRAWSSVCFDTVFGKLFVPSNYNLLYNAFMARYRTLRRNGGSLYAAVSAEVVHALGLEPGDSICWEIEDETVKVRFYKTEVRRTPAVAEQNEAAEQAA
jgi:hypothetical protein